MKIITVNELSDLLKVSPKTLYSWAELGKIPHVKFNGCLRFDFIEIQIWIESCKKEPDSGYNRFAQTARCPKKGGMN
jgi:excisionase family DNA binding protein